MGRLGRLATVVHGAQRDIEAIARQARTIDTRLDDCVGALRHELSTIAPMVADVVAAALRAELDSEPLLSDPRNHQVAETVDASFAKQSNAIASPMLLHGSPQQFSGNDLVVHEVAGQGRLHSPSKPVRRSLDASGCCSGRYLRALAPHEELA